MKLRDCLPLLMLLSAAPLAAEIYRWTDDDGTVHFGDRPRQHAESVEIRPASGSGKAGRDETSADGSGERERVRQRLLQSFEEEREQRKQAEQQAKKETEERARRCADARNKLYRYEHASGVYEHNAAGERVYLEESERAALLQRWRGEVRRWCD